ncbi:dihydroxy-acid dehydratase [Peribacillus muralis]|uniref:dihydroxy-acid dehydratase domain-containing protein n=1 Tax=Peribacillus muralis TaxID=264697 RepID=UPI001F4E4905|nr:dihydroxy-acid dehydratase [Peribacillus muralis]MCK1992946.1 dihydroxy-acid dehydratase [Peribacillus muralis]MCK2013501.1 dihydroxy-acid dehydratase [Peribacillus muralis]
MVNTFPLIENHINPYRDTVIGKANEPITVAGLLDRSKQVIGNAYDGPKPNWTLENIYDRLESNAPRIAIIGGSSDHPAHIMDYRTIAFTALRIWQNGGVPFQFSTPVMCDGTAQDHQGMSYSLQSRNAVAQMIVNQIEAHNYHGAFVLQGCDKQPVGVVSGLAQVDRVRRYRGEAPFFATFAPAHVLSGGNYPEELIEEFKEIAKRAEYLGANDIAEDIRETMSYVLVCSTNTSFQGVFERAKERGIITVAEQKDFEKRLAVSTCDKDGGVCAFNGTGNSSRHLVAGLGLIHPSLELLTQPPNRDQLYEAIDSMALLINKQEFSITNLLAANIKNAIRIHSSSGGSTNLMMHIVAAMLYGGFRFSLWEYERIRQEYPIPDLFDYSLTNGRDIFTLAKQCCSGSSKGMETLFYELQQNGVPMDLDAPTVTGKTWRERLSGQTNLSADRVDKDRVILSSPRRPFSGVDVLAGNFFESAVVKISGMSTAQLDSFDKKVNFVLYFNNEEAASRSLLDSGFLEGIKQKKTFSHELLLAVLKHNAPQHIELYNAEYDDLFDEMVKNGSLKLTVIISGQGPDAYGMPEMYTPMQHINANRKLRKLVTVVSDGRYSGVTLGAAVGHMTPEALQGGGILYLQTGDLLYMDLREKQIQFLDPEAVLEGKLDFHDFSKVKQTRQDLAAKRVELMKKRKFRVAASNHLSGHTDAANGVVPHAILEAAEIEYSTYGHFLRGKEYEKN